MRWLKKIKKRHIILVVIFLLVIVGLWHTIGYDLFHKKASDKDLPRAIMHNVVVHEYDENGQLADILVSPKIINYAKENTSFLTTPHFTIYSPPGPPWHITSLHGRATNGVDTVFLWQNVVMQRPASQLHPPAKMLTDHFTFYPHTKKGHTDAFVKMIQPGMVVTAIGAKADLNKNTITLISHTKGIYSDESKKGDSREHTARQSS